MIFVGWVVVVSVICVRNCCTQSKKLVIFCKSSARRLNFFWLGGTNFEKTGLKINQSLIWLLYLQTYFKGVKKIRKNDATKFFWIKDPCYLLHSAPQDLQKVRNLNLSG